MLGDNRPSCLDETVPIGTNRDLNRTPFKAMVPHEINEDILLFKYSASVRKLREAYRSTLNPS